MGGSRVALVVAGDQYAEPGLRSRVRRITPVPPAPELLVATMPDTESEPPPEPPEPEPPAKPTPLPPPPEPEQAQPKPALLGYALVVAGLLSRVRRPPSHP